MYFNHILNYLTGLKKDIALTQNKQKVAKKNEKQDRINKKEFKIKNINKKFFLSLEKKYINIFKKKTETDGL